MADRKTPRREPDDDERDDDAPVRKKKKKKKPAPSRGPKIAMFTAGGVLAVLIGVFVIWGIMKLAEGPPPAQPVTEWAKFKTEEGEFGFDHPAKWGANGWGLRGRREVEVKGQGATISMKENIAGSLVGDISNAANAGRPVDDDRLPVAQVHEVRKPKDSPTYKEGPAVTVNTRFGKARRSEFTDGSKRGYRVTVLLNQTALDIFCDCRATDWDALRPAFDRVIETLGHGG